LPSPFPRHSWPLRRSRKCDSCSLRGMSRARCSCYAPTPGTTFCLGASCPRPAAVAVPSCIRYSDNLRATLAEGLAETVRTQTGLKPSADGMQVIGVNYRLGGMIRGQRQLADLVVYYALSVDRKNIDNLLARRWASRDPNASRGCPDKRWAPLHIARRVCPRDSQALGRAAEIDRYGRPLCTMAVHWCEPLVPG
jgi:hypothetical protein